MRRQTEFSAAEKPGGGMRKLNIAHR